MREEQKGYRIFKTSMMPEYDKIDYQKGGQGLFARIPPRSPLNPYGEALTVAEIDFVSRVESLGIAIKLIHNNPAKPTKDFRMLGRDWELKTPITVSNMIIRNTINKATDQNKVFIILDVSFLFMKMSEIFRRIKTHLCLKDNDGKVKGLIVSRGYSLIRYK